VAGSFEQDRKPSGCVKDRNVLDLLTYYQFLKKDPALWIVSYTTCVACPRVPWC